MFGKYEELFFEFFSIGYMPVPSWKGEIPPPATRDELKKRMQERPLCHRFLVIQDQALDFLAECEKHFFNDAGEEIAYHRSCGGGALTQGATRGEEGIFCAKCGEIPISEIIPPVFLQEKPAEKEMPVNIIVYGTALMLLDRKKKPVIASKIVDITGLCSRIKKTTRAMLKFACDESSPLVQFNEEETVNGFTGKAIFFYYKNYEKKGLVRNNELAKWANDWGISTVKLAELIFRYAPPN